MEFDHTDVVPSHIAQPVIDARTKEMENKKERIIHLFFTKAGRFTPRPAFYLATMLDAHTHVW